MIKVGLVGIGAIGRVHLENYMRLIQEKTTIQLVAICDVNPDRLKGITPEGNIATTQTDVGAFGFHEYTDLDTMLASEKLDYVDIALPTYLHDTMAIKAMEKGCHVLCEKPMALTAEKCQRMIEASEKFGKKLMIAQCLRFWPAYEYLKACVEDKRYGNVTCAYFFRGGSTPRWSFENWLLKKEKSGGCLLDQHIHDVDTINWLFGMPDAVSTAAVNIIAGSGYDAVSTNYYYPDGKVVNAQDDWTLEGDYGFGMIFRVNFEKGNVILTEKGLSVNPNDEKGFIPELNPDQGYYHEVKYFAQAIENETPIVTARPESTKDTIRIAEAEMLSADRNGAIVALQH